MRYYQSHWLSPAFSYFNHPFEKSPNGLGMKAFECTLLYIFILLMKNFPFVTPGFTFNFTLILPHLYKNEKKHSYSIQYVLKALQQPRLDRKDRKNIILFR